MSSQPTKAPVSANESARLEALRRYSILDTLPEQDFDALAALAAKVCGTPIALVTLVNAERQWLKAKVGLTATQTPRDIAFCAHAILQSDLLVVPDALTDERFSGNPLVTADPHIRFYAGAPLMTPDGHALGTLCVIDRVPRELTPEQTEALRALSREVVAQLELRRMRTELAQTTQEGKAREQALRASEEFKTRLIECSQDCIKVLDLEGRLLSMNAGGMRALEICDFTPLQNSNWIEFWKGEHREAARAAVDTARRGGVGRFVGYCPTMSGKPMWWDVVVSPILSEQGLVERILAVSRDITEAKQFAQALETVAEGTAGVTGSEFFHSLVRHLASALGVRDAFVSECLDRDKNRARSLAFWQGDRFGENFEYDTAPTPCPEVLEGKICHYPKDLQALFPKDLDLGGLEAESFLGAPALNSSGDVVGHLGVLDDKLMKEDARAVSILKIFAARAGAELERQRVDRELRKTLAELQELKNRLHAENAYLQEEIRKEHAFEDMVGSSPALLAVLQKVQQVAPTDSTVLIYGETGTGKELIARAIHSHSARSDRPLVKVNCSAISAGLVESELFGHVKGAFTGALERRVGRFELADGGTIFLDEIGELPLETQVKLLRVLQEQEFEPVGSSKTVRVDVRIIAATNRNLEEAVQAGRFRSDLFYRLDVFPIEVPPLRERRAEIPQLAAFFLTRFSRKFGKRVNTVRQETMNCLMNYPWPGNIRELQNIIERAVILSQGSVLELERNLFPSGESDFTVTEHVGSMSHGLDRVGSARSQVESPAASGSPSLQNVENRHIVAVLEQTGGVIEGPKGAARILGLHPNTLRSRMKKLGIKRVSHETS